MPLDSKYKKMTASEYAKVLNAKVKARQKPGDWGGMLVTDPEHWAEYDIHTAEELEKYLLFTTFWDLYKDVHGIRPRWASMDDMSYEEIQNEIDQLERDRQAFDESIQRIVKEEVAQIFQELKEEKLKTKNIKFELSPSDLQLYSDTKGIAQAARSISAALTKAAKQLVFDLDKIKTWYDDWKHASIVDEAIYNAMKMYVYPILNKYRHQGADDTEPHWVVKSKLVKVAKDALGQGPFSRIGDGL